MLYGGVAINVMAVTRWVRSQKKGEAMRFCCQKLMDEVSDNFCLQILDSDEGLGIYFTVVDGVGREVYPIYKLNFCPFCGNKIIIKK